MTTSDDRIWRALADPVRREIVEHLDSAPRTTGDLVTRFDRLCRTAVMKHLDVLVAANLVAVERIGRVRWNRLNREPLETICLPWVVRYARKLPAALERLKAVVESAPIDVDTESPTSTKKSPSQKVTS